MGSLGCQLSALFLVFLGLIFLLVAIVSNVWKYSNQKTALIIPSWIYEGLWMSCITTSFGSVQCKRFSYLLSVDSFAFTLAGWMIIGATLSNSYWKVSSIHGSVITTSTLYENLWHSCAEDSIGVSNCRKFDTLLALPAYIQVCRALMIASLILGVCGTVLTLYGLNSTLLGSSSKNVKKRIAMTGGVVFILGGLSSMVAVSLYAARITAQFFNSLYGGTKYELGYALYLGWAGSLLSMLGGSFLTCSARQGKHRNPYEYRAGERCIDTKPSEVVTSAKDYV